MTDPTLLRLEAVSKSFTNHLRGAVHLPVVERVGLTVARGEIAILGGPSGVGKSSILRMIFGNYGVQSGQILMRSAIDRPFVDLAAASPRTVIALRRTTIGYVSQFLRAIPRVSAVDVVAQPLREHGASMGDARDQARDLLARLNLPRALFDLPPATFSGGEKQRVNIARGLAANHPILLLDEPTASLDAQNRDIVCAMIEEKRARGTAILGIFHDAEVRERLGGRIVDVSGFSARAKVA